MPKATLILGDCIEKMKELEEASIDVVITDPPYGLEFMGKDWDSFDSRINEGRKDRVDTTCSDTLYLNCSVVG